MDFPQPNELFLLEHNYALPRLENVEDVEHAERQRQHHLEIVRRRRANISLQQAQQRRAADALRQNARRAVENVADANARQHADAKRHRANRENELPQQAAVRRRADVLRHRVARAPRLLNLARINNVLPPTHSAVLSQWQSGPACHSNDSAQAKQFRKYIRVYNNAFSFASLSANIRPPPGRGPPCFRIYVVNYFTEAAAALNMRIENPTHAHCNRETTQIIQDVLNWDSPYAAAYSNMAEVEREETARAAAENRQPSVEVAAIFVGNDGAPPAARDIVVYPRNQPLRQIPYTSCNIDPMVYPILFPRGEPGWDPNMAHVRKHATRVRNRLTQLEYYIYRIAIRREFSALHLAGKLFQQFLVDAYVKVEGQRLAFIRLNQNQLRAESYQGLLDYIQNAADQRNLQAGNVVVLPSTFSGSPRNMHQLYLDAMALVSQKGKPDLFLTFTCNPKWPEIVTNLLPGQSASDRPDLVARVFKSKILALKKDLKDSVLGVLCAHVDVIEFQKRGLPHVHMLLHLHNEFKLQNADDIDSGSKPRCRTV
ncbi:uncharacterized protein LOC130626007 [Hydractinia symbiolongicarpus]|uniref:uncharacterized protein LOC130626007 n=1 Tax=Hydractinia symbiolongicarpus TaxID=13093 RepID=UPI00254BCE5E|nr:uncharacterized protein LOC130626007 [Hydractinia symbiolongicarpus]